MPKGIKSTPEEKEAARIRNLERAKARYWANKQAILARAKEWRQEVINSGQQVLTEEQKQYQKEYQKQYRKLKSNEINKRRKEWNRVNRDRINKRSREKHAENPEIKRARQREWAAKNPEKVRARNAASRLNRRANGGRKLRVNEVLAVKSAHGDICFYCKEANATDIEHMTPICRGGTNDIENLVMSCKLCNNRKFKQTAEEFIRRGIDEGFLKAEHHPSY